jgi:hypothetical protein
MLTGEKLNMGLRSHLSRGATERGLFVFSPIGPQPRSGFAAGTPATAWLKRPFTILSEIAVPILGLSRLASVPGVPARWERDAGKD